MGIAENAAAPPSGTPPTPALIFESLNAYHRTAAVKAAIELEVFTAIAAGAHTAASLALSRGASARGMAILCDALTVYGLLLKAGDDYALTPDSALFLDRNSPAYLGTVADFLVSDFSMAAFAHLTDAVKKGGTALPGKGATENENPGWVTFARCMAPMMNLQAQAMASCLMAGSSGPIKVLDVAAGHGLFGIAVATRNREAQVYALDWGSVLEVAKENAAAAGVGERLHPIAGDAFTTPVGEGYDWVLTPNFLHHFDVATCTDFLRKMRTALRAGGKIAVLEFMPNDDRVSPPGASLFALIMLATTPAGNAYTLAELSGMLRAAGFSGIEEVPMSGGLQRLMVAQKA